MTLITKKILGIIMSVALLISARSVANAACFPNDFKQCFGETKYLCVDDAKNEFCCSASELECRGISAPVCDGGFLVGQKKCVRPMSISSEQVCVLINGQAKFSEPTICEYGCANGVGCLPSPNDSGEEPLPGGPTNPNPSEYENVATGKFLYDIDPLNPVNSGNSTNIFDGIRQFFRFSAFQTPGGVLSLLLPPLFTIAGLIVFVMVVWGGFEMLMSATSSKAQEAGKQRITAAIIGFVLLFISYWLAQIIQMIFGVRILG